MRLALAAALVLGLASSARADGWMSMRTGYYKERSTRVIQPMIDAQLEISDTETFEVHGLVDSITSASAATGAPVMPGQRVPQFDELRYEGGVSYSHAFDGFRLGGTFKTSTESDYDSNYLGLRGELSLLDKNTVLALNVGRSFDHVTDGVSGMGNVDASLNVGNASLSLTQLLSPRLVGSLNWDFIDAHGFQANPYRKVTGGTAPVAEKVPDLRLRNAVYAGVRGILPDGATTGVLGYRFYIDDWGILAHTVEARVIRELTRGLELRLRYRFYVQGKADFYEDTYTATQIMNNPYVAADAKLSAFHTQTFGGQVLAALALFGVTGSWSEVRMDLIVERILQTNSFGDAWSAQLGLVVPVAF